MSRERLVTKLSCCLLSLGVAVEDQLAQIWSHYQSATSQALLDVAARTQLDKQRAIDASDLLVLDLY
jgi:hypothetical protein